MQGKRILVVEDERAIRDMICRYLRCHAFEVSEACDIESARRLLCEQTPHLIVLEWKLPEGNGLELARSVRSSQRQWLPLLMITARAAADARATALEAGVDDIVSKPFSLPELRARINALLRRREPGTSRWRDLNAGLVLDAARQTVMVGDRSIELPPMDFRLLSFFLQNPERAHSRADLVKNVWGGAAHTARRTVDVQVQRLRSTLEPLGMRQLIQTVQGVGYRFSACTDPRAAGRSGTSPMQQGPVRRSVQE